jgi:hypothetical protein
VAFATRIEGAIAFVRSLEITDPWVIIRKRFNPADFLLDFSSLRAKFDPDEDGRFENEHEVWMRATPNYSSVNKDEVVLTSQQYFKDSIEENFANGKKPGRKGLAKRSGVNTKASVSSLRKTAKHSTGEKQRLSHWLANMKAGKAKKK